MILSRLAILPKNSAWHLNKRINPFDPKSGHFSKFHNFLKKVSPRKTSWPLGDFVRNYIPLALARRPSLEL
jgi:hypothetical protein